MIEKKKQPRAHQERRQITATGQEVQVSSRYGKLVSIRWAHHVGKHLAPEGQVSESPHALSVAEGAGIVSPRLEGNVAGPIQMLKAHTL